MMYLITFALLSLLLTASSANATTPRWMPTPDLEPYKKDEENTCVNDDVVMLRIANWIKAEQEAQARYLKAAKAN